MAKNKSGAKKPRDTSGRDYARRARIERQERKMAELGTITGMKKIIIRMMTAGLVFLLTGLLMPRIAPFYAEKSWKLLIGVTLSLPHAVAIFGCIMLIVAIVCFLRSYRCAKCRGLLALTPFTRVTTCRSCGAKVTDNDLMKPRGGEE